jgi:hypothetical protein
LPEAAKMMTMDLVSDEDDFGHDISDAPRGWTAVMSEPFQGKTKRFRVYAHPKETNNKAS